jgi:hypothetical protein
VKTGLKKDRPFWGDARGSLTLKTEDHMKHSLCGLIILVYIWIVYFSVAMLPAMSESIEERHPRVIDKRWKRVIWLLSRLLLLRYLVVAGRPSFATEEARWFLRERGKK